VDARCEAHGRDDQVDEGEDGPARAK